MKRYLYSIYFYFKFKFLIRKKIIYVLKDYLTEDTILKCSYLKEKIIVKNYSTRFLKGEEEILGYLNKVFKEFPLDRIKYEYSKVEISSEKLPENFNPPIKTNGMNKIPLAITVKGIVFWNTLENNSLYICAPQGSGKTTSFLTLLTRIERFHLSESKTFQSILIIDYKNESDFEKLETNERIKIIHTQQEAFDCLTQLEEQADLNEHVRTLVICEEYNQLISAGNKKQAVQIARILQKINTFYRSKKICIALTTQLLQANENEINVDNYIKIISSPSKAYALLKNIPQIYCNRDNLIHGRYLLIQRGVVSVCRMNGEIKQ